MNEEKVRQVMKETLAKEKTTVSFDAVWDASQKSEQGHKRIRIFKKWPIILAAAFMVFTMGTIIAKEALFRVDDISYRFCTDKNIIDTWILVDYVKDKADFKGGKKIESEDRQLQAIIFNEGGSLINVYLNSKNEPCAMEGRFDWTKDYVIDPQNQTKNHYSIEEIEGKEYLFLENKNGDYTYKHLDQPYLYVFERGTLNESQMQAVMNKDVPVNQEDTDIIFENAPEMLGKWKVVDFVEKVSDFDSKRDEDKYWSPDSLSEMIFKERGILEKRFQNGDACVQDQNWSGHKIIDQELKTVSSCIQETIDGKQYLFYEFKNGDYVYRDETPWYYVLVKE